MPTPSFELSAISVFFVSILLTLIFMFLIISMIVTIMITIVITMRDVDYDKT